MINDLITYDFTNKSWGRALNSSPPSTRFLFLSLVLVINLKNFNFK